MKILFTSPILEHPAIGGPQLRIENSIKALSEICDVFILNRAVIENKEQKITQIFFKKFSIQYHSHFLHEKKISNTLPSKLFQLSRDRLTNTKRSFKLLSKIVTENNISIVWFGYGNISYSLIKKVKKNLPDLILVCDTDSVWSRFILRELPYANNFRKISIYFKGLFKKHEEKKFVKLCDVTTAVSEVDANYYRTLTKNRNKVKVFANVIDFNNYANIQVNAKELQKPSVYLAGTFGHYNSPMDMAARWLIQEIMPIVWKTLPNVHLYILGRNSKEQFSHIDNKNISVLGKVDSVVPYLKSVDVALVPLHFESGTRFKILEAAACQVPVVSTSLGAEGLDIRDGVDLLIADSATEFSDAILELLSNPEFSRAIALNCHNQVKSSNSLEALQSQGQKILNFLVEKTINF